MDENFYNWALPKYFIFNYMTSEFHRECSIKEEEWTLGEHFIQHLALYLIKSFQFRGKWIQQFVLTSDFIKAHQDQKCTQIKKQQTKAFQNLVYSLRLTFDHLLFVCFLGKFFRMIYLNSKDESNQFIQQLHQVYFCYRLQLSFKNQIDVGEPPQIINLLNLIHKYRNILGQIFQESNEKNSFIRKIAQVCQFQNVLNRLINQSTQIRPNNSNIFQSPKKNTEKVKQKEYFNTNQSKKPRFEDKYLGKSPNKQILHVQNLYIEVQHKKEGQEVIPLVVKGQIENKKTKRFQSSRKIIKTTRFSSFKGIFNKKIAYPHRQSEISYNEKLNLEKKNEALQKNKEKQKKKCFKNNQQEDDIYFLCDRSF